MVSVRLFCLLFVALLAFLLQCRLSVFLHVNRVATTNSVPVGCAKEDLVPSDIRDAIQRQQFDWCIANKGVNGFQMDDASLCWAPACHITVVNLSSPLYKDIYEVALEPQAMLANKHIRVVGDSIARFMFHAMYSLLSNQEPIYHWSHEEYHAMISHHIPKPSNITMEWFWAPRASDVRAMLDQLDLAGDLEKADYNIIGIGNHQRQEQKMKSEFPKKMLDSINEDHAPRMKNLVFQTAPRHPSANQTQMEFEELFNGWLAREYTANNIDVVDTFWPFQVEDQKDGIHSRTHAMYACFVHLWRWKWMQAASDNLDVKQLHSSTDYNQRFSHTG